MKTEFRWHDSRFIEDAVTISPAFYIRGAQTMVVKLSYEQLSALRRIDSPTISNAIETFHVRPRVAGYGGYDIRSIFPELPPTVSYALTRIVHRTTVARHR